MLEPIILGTVQGLTEWLPVSSSGHLVIFEEFFKMKTSLFFNIILHIASLLVLLIVFRNDIKKIILSFFKKEYKNYRKIGYLIIIGTIFTAIIALIFKDIFVSLFSNTLVVGIALLITGSLLFFSKFVKEKKQEVNFKDSIFIGLMQGFAIIPGISRSGSTISLGLFLGLKREEAARFSFLLFIPAVIGALLFDLLELKTFDNNLSSLVIGFIVSFIVSYLTLKWFLKLIRNKSFHKFAYYCFILGVIVVLFSL